MCVRKLYVLVSRFFRFPIQMNFAENGNTPPSPDLRNPDRRWLGSSVRRRAAGSPRWGQAYGCGSRVGKKFLVVKRRGGFVGSISRTGPEVGAAEGGQ